MPTLPNDTLIANQHLLHDLQTDGRYDYGRELFAEDENIISRALNSIGQWISDLLQDLFASADDAQTRPIWILGGIVVVALVVWLVYRNHYGIFRRRNTNAVDYNVQTDDIYAIDMASELAKALRNADWQAAARFRYLQLLRLLADNNLIDWKLFKTVVQYVGEWPDQNFRQATHLFLRVRYGRFNADEQAYRQIDNDCTAAENTANEQIIAAEQGSTTTDSQNENK